MVSSYLFNGFLKSILISYGGNIWKDKVRYKKGLYNFSTNNSSAKDQNTK